MFPIQPRGNKIIALPIEKKEEQVGSIIIAATVNMALSYAEVIAVDVEAGHQYNVGDVVIHPEGSGVGHMIAGKTYIWLQVPEIWGIYTEQ
jgi:co-chaperonin GroES (HSP10)